MQYIHNDYIEYPGGVTARYSIIMLPQVFICTDAENVAESNTSQKHGSSEISTCCFSGSTIIRGPAVRPHVQLCTGSLKETIGAVVCDSGLELHTFFNGTVWNIDVCKFRWFIFLF